VIPPRVAETQAALIPVGLTAKTRPETKQALLDQLQSIGAALKEANIRVEVDASEGRSPGWKFNQYELMGVPLRIEFGPKDAAKGVVTTVRRDNGVKGSLDISNIAKAVSQLLDQIQQDMYSRAKAAYDSHRVEVTDWNAVVPALNNRNTLSVPHCLDGNCADAIKQETADICKAAAEVDPRAPSMGAKSLCIPFEQRAIPAGTKCIRPACGKDAQKWVLFGRSY